VTLEVVKQVKIGRHRQPTNITHNGSHLMMKELLEFAYPVSSKKSFPSEDIKLSIKSTAWPDQVARIQSAYGLRD
jgi:hypothetical protein